MNDRFVLRKTSDGVWYAHDKLFPYIGHPESFGSKQKAQAYIAGWSGMTWEEYQSKQNRRVTDENA